MKGDNTPQDRINRAATVLFDVATTDGEHHKQWAIDQALRILLGDDQYFEMIGREAVKSGTWDTGDAP